MNIIVINMNNQINHPRSLKKKLLNPFAQAKEIKHQSSVTIKAKIHKKEKINKMMPFLKNKSYLNPSLKLLSFSIIITTITTKLILF